jgi:hypothetical protein
MRVQYSITAEDFVALQHFGDSLRPTAGFGSRLWSWFLIALVACVVVVLTTQEGATIHWDSLGIYVVLAFWAVLVYLVITGWWAKRTFPQRAFREAKARHMTEGLLLELQPDGLKHTSNGATNTVTWPGVKRIDEFEGHLFFLLDDNWGFVIPRRAFADEEQYRTFAETARRYQADNRSTSGEG